MGSVTDELSAIAQSEDVAPRRPWLSTILAIAAACVVMFLLMAAAVAVVDIRSGGPDARAAAKQGRLNGENLCEFAVAVSDVLVVLGETQPLSDEQAAALERMKHVAANCQSSPVGDP